MSGIENILDLRRYTNGMCKSIIDKTYFIDTIRDKVDTIVDYGCADGSLIDYLGNCGKLGNIKFIGFDNNNKMVELAKSKCNTQLIFSNWKDVIRNCSTDQSMINISSVIHEVYSYMDSDYIDKFWNIVYNSGFKYISIRDLMISKSSLRISDDTDVQKIRSQSNKQMLLEFEDNWGSINMQNNLLHYLLKYRFKENWLRENAENYTAVFLEDFLSNVPLDKYEIVLFDHYTLPFLKKKVMSDFNISITDNTHIKIILRLRD